MKRPSQSNQLKRQQKRQQIKENLLEWLSAAIFAAPIVAFYIAHDIWGGWIWVVLMWACFFIVLALGIRAMMEPWDEWDGLDDD